MIPWDDLDPVAVQLLEEAGQRKDFLSQPEVAKHLGVHPRTLRSWVKKGLFPKPVIQSANGRKDLWLRIDVWAHEMMQFQNKMPPKEGARFKSADDFDRADAGRYALLDLKTQGSMKRQSQMIKLLVTDEAAFSKKYPNLRQWLKVRKTHVSYLKYKAKKLG